MWVHAQIALDWDDIATTLCLNFSGYSPVGHEEDEGNDQTTEYIFHDWILALVLGWEK
jgi:hypothetical protein